MESYTRDSIRHDLQNPPLDARGYTRWWWFGGAVTQEEISRELDLMLEAGIGGVELQILYPVYADDAGKKIKNQFYLSPEYFASIRYACEEAKKRGMTFDMTLGSSWPFGGPFVPQKYSAPNVIPYTLDVKGPVEFSYDFTTRLYGECVGCVMGRMENCQMIPESIVDITHKVTDKYLFGWEWGKELQPVSVPEGDYKIVVFISNEKRQMVLKPLPGGEGPIIDHDSKEALRHFLRAAGDPIAEKTGPGMIQSFFCDSIEVFGQNWTEGIYEEFRKRRGYELRPYIYALWGEVKGCTEQVRYDFHKTLGELTEENFFCELTKWCHEKGTTSRIQAHGTWGDILRTYGAADIPEGETFSEYDRLEVNTVHRRLAASAGHVYHKPVISNESFTWLRFPRFVVTLENMKAAVDSIFLDGMNQIVNHGFAYSPKDSGKLGWPFYASTQINDRNPWWPYYKELGRYINRVSDWLRRGEPVAKIAVYLPQADIWAENPLSDIHMCMKLEERLTTAVVDAVQKAGYWFDYVNDDVLERFSQYGYQALLVLECDRIPVETARAMGDYARRGGCLICKGHTPDRSCGLTAYEEKTREIREIFEELTGEGLCMLTEDTAQGVISALGQAGVRPDVEMLHHRDVAGYVHRREAGQDIYFVSNISGQWIEEEIVFSGQEGGFAVFDPLTVQEKEAEAFVVEEKETKDTHVRTVFEPFQSLLFVFAKGCSRTEEKEPLETPEKKMPVSLKGAESGGALAGMAPWMDLSTGGWSLEVPETGFTKTYDALESWEKEPELRYFSGEGIYRKSFVLDGKNWESLEEMRRSGGRIWLTLEHLGVAGEVFVNGKSASVLFKRPYRVEMGKLLQEGLNELEIRVRNLLINCAIDPDYPEEDYPEPVTEHWPYSTGRLNLNREEWIYNHRERAKVKEPLPSGIWGSVKIETENPRIK